MELWGPNIQPDIIRTTNMKLLKYLMKYFTLTQAHNLVVQVMFRKNKCIRFWTYLLQSFPLTEKFRMPTQNHWSILVENIPTSLHYLVFKKYFELYKCPLFYSKNVLGNFTELSFTVFMGHWLAEVLVLEQGSKSSRLQDCTLADPILWPQLPNKLRYGKKRLSVNVLTALTSLGPPRSELAMVSENWCREMQRTRGSV